MNTFLKIHGNSKVTGRGKSTKYLIWRWENTAQV